MPASRNARAITFAPRSCPSSPGFATSTRILTSTISNHLTTECTGVHRGRREGSQYSLFFCDPPCPLWLRSLDIETSPHIPASHAAIRFPCPRDLLHILRFGQLALFVVFADGHLHAIIASGKHIRTLQGEHQEHVRRPDSDALHLRQMLDHLFVCQFMQSRKIEQSTRRLRRQVL